MSFLDTIRGTKPGPKPIQPLQAPDVARRLAAAEAEIAELEAQHGVAALDALAAGNDTESLAGVGRRLQAARERVTTLKAAHRAAVQRDDETIRAQRAALRKTQLAAMRKHLEARDLAAQALSVAIAECAKQYRVLIERSEKARAACPIGCAWPQGGTCEIDPLRRLVEHEIYRLSAAPGNRREAFPGAQLPGLEFEWQPEAIKPLADAVNQASAFAVASLTGKAL